MLSRITLFTAVLAICGGLFTVGGIVVPIKDAHAGKYGDKDKKCPKPARYRTKDGKCVASGVKKRAGIKAYKARTLALQKKAPEFTFAKQLPIFRGYEDCMIRTLYSIGGRKNGKSNLGSKPHTEFMNKAQFSNYHNKCFSDVLNGEGDSKYEVEYSKYGLAITTGNAPITDALVRKQLDFLRCDYVRNRNIAQYNVSMGGELQYRICRKINYVKGTAVSFAD